MAGVVQIYNGQIGDMRRQGYTLQWIGDTIGVTRERVRQVINKYYSGAKPRGMSESKVAGLLGIHYKRLVVLRQNGKVQPKLVGRNLHYSQEDIVQATIALTQNCPQCGVNFISRVKRKYCSQCGAERQRYQYPFMSDEAKQRHLEHNQHWRKRNPERAREIQRRANHKYEEKKRAQNN